MRTLTLGSTGEDVKKWQTFLRSAGRYQGALDGIFGAATSDATKAFQAGQGVPADGAVGNQTLAKAIEAGFEVTTLDPTLAGATMPLGNDWEPAEPPVNVDLFAQVDPRVDTAHQVSALPCPSNPPPPVGWAYWTGPVSAALSEFASTIENNGATYPMGSFVQAVRDQQRVAARVEWHNYKGRTGEHGCFRGTSLFRSIAPAAAAAARVSSAVTTA